jgi:hypothetical protein
MPSLQPNPLSETTKLITAVENTTIAAEATKVVFYRKTTSRWKGTARGTAQACRCKKTSAKDIAM